MAFVFKGNTLTSLQPVLNSQDSQPIVYVERVHQQEVVWGDRKLNISLRSGLDYQSLLQECLTAFDLNKKEEYELMLPDGQVLSETYVTPFEGIANELILRSNVLICVLISRSKEGRRIFRSRTSLYGK